MGFVVVGVWVGIGVGFAVISYGADHHRTRVSGSTPVAPVLVAKQLIPKGTPGSLIASQSMYASMVLLTKEREVGAISDPAYLTGRVSVVDILPGQQLTATNFTSRG
jgi:hypothetical protein